MKDIALFGGIILLWFLLQAYVLPRLGVKT